MLLPTIEHTVKKGDNLTAIVKKYGFPGGAWKSIYNATYNKDFRKACPNPNLILPGKVFVLPSVPKSVLMKGKTYLDKAKAHYQAEIALQDFNLHRYDKLETIANQESDKKLRFYKTELKALKSAKPGDGHLAKCKEIYVNPIFLVFFTRCQSDVARHNHLIKDVERLTKMAVKADLTKKDKTIADLRALRDTAGQARAHAEQILSWLLEIEKKVTEAMKATV